MFNSDGKRSKISAKILVISAERALLIRRSAFDRYAPRRWDLPGGSSDENETAKQAALRELREEVGFEADPKLLELHSKNLMVRPDRQYSRHCFTYRASSIFNVELSKEHSEFKWMDLAEIELTDLPEFYKVASRELLS